LYFAYAKVLQQAIGRICRTANKNEKIYILSLSFTLYLSKIKVNVC